VSSRGGVSIDVDDITAALASRDVAKIKEAFLALANDPKEGRVTGLVAETQ
jgi:hypothetical protein